MVKPQPHVVVVPHPSIGHVNPALLQLAQLLHHHGISVTFVSTEHNNLRAQAAADSFLLSCPDGFRLETIPDGLLDDDRRGSTLEHDVALSKSTSRRCAAPLRELVARLRDGSKPVTCVLPTALMSFALDVARELGVPSMVFWVSSAASLSCQMRLRELRERGYLPLKDESCLTNGYLEETIIDWIPGLPPICLGDVSSFVRTTDPDDFILMFNDTEANNCTKAGAVILNTFDAVDVDGLNALRAEYPRVYTVGPVGLLLHRTFDDAAADGEPSEGTMGGGLSLSLRKQDAACLAWLDAQEPGSVVYASFGSLVVLTAEQLAEFAWGLAATGRPFLWVVSEELVPGAGGGPAALPAEGFLSEAGARCYVTTWCPQPQVLRHRAVGCFLTHNGSNSTLEALAAGVPMVCWPAFADGYTNCKYACEVWGVGVRLEAEVSRELVASRIVSVMESEGMRTRAARWKAEAEKAVCPGGSSYESLHSLMEALGGAVSLNSTTEP
ncbi:hypothetical protein BS78_07G080100 [Paspalum vaginatum]|nr:hypothetical protein BS78_07G080100 [Paspalum vaginatum]